MTIKSRYGMSSMLNHGCKGFAEKAANDDVFDDVINLSQKNMAALIFGYTSIEAYINEIISLAEVSEQLTVKKEYLCNIKELERKLGIKEKYNLLAGLIGEETWNSSIEPFQSFDLIQTIRNEVIHHKGTWIEKKEEPPIKKIKPLFSKLKIQSTPNRHWQSELFQCREFGNWVYEKSNKM